MDLAGGKLTSAASLSLRLPQVEDPDPYLVPTMELPRLGPALDEDWLDESHHPSNPNPNPSSEPALDHNLRPVSSTAFKREARKKRKERKRVHKLEEKLESLLAFERDTRVSADPAAVSTNEWPTVSDPNPEPTGWAVPAPNPQPAAAPPPPSAEEQVRITSLQVQQNVMGQCQDFFSTNDDGDDSDDEDEAEDVDFKYFVELFEKDGDLRGFYENNWEKGEFCCLVCGGIGEKIGKRYLNCVGLVQHANTVSKTKRRGGHRAFARAVCTVLGWDIDKLPGVFDGQSLARDGDPMEAIPIQKQIAVVEEVGPQEGDSSLVGPDKEHLMDYMEADANTD